MRLRIAFMGTSDFAVPILMALVEKYEVVCVYTQNTSLETSKNTKYLSPVYRAASTINLPIRTPQTWKETDTQRELSLLNVDVGIVAAYGLILPDSAFTIPKLGCLNIHASLLPRWRGASPIQRAIMEDDVISGITILQINTGLDTGPILTSAKIPLTDKATFSNAQETLAYLGANLLLNTLENFESILLSLRLQSPQGTIYAKKIITDNSRINWTLSAAELSAIIRGLSPYPGAFCYHDKLRLRILMATAENRNCTEHPGTVLDSSLSVACGTGILHVLKIQRPGKEILSTKPFLRGYPLQRGSVLS